MIEKLKSVIIMEVRQLSLSELMQLDQLPPYLYKLVGQRVQAFALVQDRSDLKTYLVHPLLEDEEGELFEDSVVFPIKAKFLRLVANQT